MSTAMLTKQKTLISARHSLWNSAAHRAWTQMNLDPGWNPAASGGQEGDMPRGTGEGLDQLQNRIEPPILQQADNADAIEYFQRVWGNLPGRHEQHSRTGFSTGAPLWSFLNRTVEGDHYRDSSPWPIWHLNAWKICQENTLLEFRETFHAELDVVQEPFEYTRDLILNNLFDDKAPGMDE
jgi:hypothetical protein